MTISFSPSEDRRRARERVSPGSRALASNALLCMQFLRKRLACGAMNALSGMHLYLFVHFRSFCPYHGSSANFLFILRGKSRPISTIYATTQVLVSHVSQQGLVSCGYPTQFFACSSRGSDRIAVSDSRREDEVVWLEPTMGPRTLCSDEP